MKDTDPSGIAIIVDALTDNKNRTASQCPKRIHQREAEALEHRAVYPTCFDEKGQIIIDKEECDMDADDLMMLALDAGAEDFSEEEDSFEILTAPDDFSACPREALEKEGVPMASGRSHHDPSELC